MTWNFYEDKHKNHIAFQSSPTKILLTASIGYYKDEMEVMEEDDTEIFSINPDGSFKFETEGYNEFTQFNCCHSLWLMIECLNQQISQQLGTAPVELDQAAILKEESVFKVIETKFDVPTPKGYGYDHEFLFELDGKTYKGQQQFIKYTFLSNDLLKKTWTIKEIANFTLHMMKYICEAETQYQPGKENFLSSDQEVCDLLQGK